jgi:hypothetical protein
LLSSAVTKLSDYILQNGCTAPVKAQLKNLLESDYQGNTFAMVGALRALDVRTTPVAALGVCLQETVSEEALPSVKADDGN